MQLGDPQTALQFAQLAQPKDDAEARKITLSQNEQEGKQWKTVDKGIKNFRQIIDAAQEDSGSAAYSLMIKYIKNLDDSVVREGEVRTFGNFQGVYKNFMNTFERAKGKGFTPQIRNELVQLDTTEAYSENEWKGVKQWNKPNSLVIKPNETKNFALKLILSKGIKNKIQLYISVNLIGM